MPLPTREVSYSIVSFVGEEFPVNEIALVIMPTKNSVVDGYLVPTTTKILGPDSAGEGTIDLTPNSLGVPDFDYRCILRVFSTYGSPGGYFESDFGKFRVPETAGPFDLGDLLAQFAGGLTVGNVVYDTLSAAVAAAVNAAAAAQEPVATQLANLGSVYVSGTADDDGTVSAGTYNPTPVGGNFKKIVNGGTFTFAAPAFAGDYTLIVQITNNASAGAIAFSGFSRVAGDIVTTDNGHDFFVFITKCNGFTSASVQALQ